MLYLPTRHAQIGTELDVSDLDLELPSFANPVPVGVLSEGVTNKHGGYDAYIELLRGAEKLKVIIVNTFTELEPYAVQSFAHDGLLRPKPGGSVNPPSIRENITLGNFMFKL